MIISAGPERSGSTWLFNAIRVLLQEARQPLDPFWVTSLSQHALAERGAGGRCTRHAGTPCSGGTPSAEHRLRDDTKAVQAHNAGQVYDTVGKCVRAGQSNRPHVLVKTHRWSDDWDPSTADLVFLTHRDLRAVLASYQRVGWTFHIPNSYVAEHMRWQVRMCGLCRQPSCAVLLCHTKRSSVISATLCASCRGLLIMTLRMKTSWADRMSRWRFWPASLA